MKANSCKNCGSILTYNPATGTLTCEHCGSSFAIENDNVLNVKKDYTKFVQLKETSVNQYHCTSCGSNLNTIKDALVKRCPNCGSTALTQTNKISYTPDAIIPFRITKEKATENFYNWITKRRFAPKNLKKMAKLGKLSGLYTPIWNFDCQTFTKYHGIGIDEYKDSEGNVHTSSHPFRGEFSSNYQNIMMSANKQISDVTIMNLQPFGLDNLKVYNIEYLCGFIGTDTDYDIHTSYNLFVNQVKNKEKSKAKRRHSYDSIEHFECHTDIYQPKYNYIYLPIWANYYTYKNKNYSCYINGYTGKVCGTSPKSIGKILALVFGIASAILIAMLVSILIGRSIGGNFTPSIPKVPSGFDFNF